MTLGWIYRGGLLTQWSMIEGGLVVIKVKRKLRALSFQSIDFKT